MSFVVDASVAAAWLLPDENNQDAERALSLLESEDALVPDLFWHEMRNISSEPNERKQPLQKYSNGGGRGSADVLCRRCVGCRCVAPAGREQSGRGESAVAAGKRRCACPDLFWHEMRNILLTAERRHRIASADVLACLMRLESLPLRTIFDDDHPTVIRLARKHQLSAYDAAYLALALIQAVPLATADVKLKRAAEAERLPLQI